ncbi:MAG: flagellar brake protein [Pseudomonadota bacterium]
MDKMTVKPQIVGLLKRLHSQRALLSVTLPGSEKHFNSAVLEVNGEQNYLVLDELGPAEGHALLLKTREFRARARLEGARVSFSATVGEVGNDAGIAFYKLPIPEELDYLQQRAHYRIKAGPAKPITVILTLSDANTLQGELHDISMGGVAIRVAQNKLPASLKIMDMITCKFSFSQGEELTCALEIRSIRNKDGNSHTHLGCRFTNLPAPCQKLIQRHVAAMEREQIKKIAKTA